MYKNLITVLAAAEPGDTCTQDYARFDPRASSRSRSCIRATSVTNPVTGNILLKPGSYRG